MRKFSQINEEDVKKSTSASRNREARDSLHGAFADIANYYGRSHSNMPSINHTGTHHTMTMWNGTEHHAEAIAKRLGSKASVHVEQVPEQKAESGTTSFGNGQHSKWQKFARPAHTLTHVKLEK